MVFIVHGFGNKSRVNACLYFFRYWEYDGNDLPVVSIAKRSEKAVAKWTVEAKTIGSVEAIAIASVVRLWFGLSLPLADAVGVDVGVGVRGIEVSVGVAVASIVSSVVMWFSFWFGFTFPYSVYLHMTSRDNVAIAISTVRVDVVSSISVMGFSFPLLLCCHGGSQQN